MKRLSAVEPIAIEPRCHRLRQRIEPSDDLDHMAVTGFEFAPAIFLATRRTANASSRLRCAVRECLLQQPGLEFLQRTA